MLLDSGNDAYEVVRYLMVIRTTLPLIRIQGRWSVQEAALAVVYYIHTRKLPTTWDRAD